MAREVVKMGGAGDWRAPQARPSAWGQMIKLRALTDGAPARAATPAPKCACAPSPPFVEDGVGLCTQRRHLHHLWDLAQLLQPAALHKHTEPDEAKLRHGLAKRAGHAAVAAATGARRSTARSGMGCTVSMVVLVMVAMQAECMSIRVVAGGCQS
eukprot:355489-Chlamydomonas_euryale.AAC.2